MRRLETSVESSFSNWVKNNYPDWEIIKLSALGYNGWPDRLLFGPGRTIFFIEFKREGEEPRPLQFYIHEILRRFGFDIWICKTKKEAQEVFARYL